MVVPVVVPVVVVVVVAVVVRFDRGRQLGRAFELGHDVVDERLDLADAGHRAAGEQPVGAEQHGGRPEAGEQVGDGLVGVVVRGDARPSRSSGKLSSGLGEDRHHLHDAEPLGDARAAGRPARGTSRSPRT